MLGPRRLPSPQSLWPAIFTDLYTNKILEFQGGGNRGIWPHLLYTIRQTVLGSVIGTGVGILLGIAMARWHSFFVFMEVPVGALRTIPPLAAIPFMVLWFGPSQVAQLAMVGYYVGVMVTVTATTAIRNLDPLTQNFARTLGASEDRVFSTVVLPAIIPELVGGIRVAVGVAWGIEVISELAGAPEGMGQVFSRMVAFQELSVIIVGIFWVTVAAFIADLFITGTSDYLTRWAPRQEKRG